MVRIGTALFATLLVAGAIFARGSGGAPAPTVPLPDAVVLFGAESIQVDGEANVLGGDTATNRRAQIGRDVNLQGSLLADDAHFSQDVTILGNLEADTIQGSDPTVQGETITPRITDDYELPALPDATPGNNDVRIKKGETATLQPGRYRNITIDRGASVTFEPGTYDVRRLHVGRGSILTIEGATDIRVSNNLFIGSTTIVDLATDLTTDDLTWNYGGHGATHIGSGTFGAGIVLAPNATVQVGETATWRGRLIAKRVTIGKSAIISFKTTFNIPSSADSVIEDPAGGLIIVNEILVNLEEDVPVSVLDSILNEVNGTIVGHINIMNEYKIRIEADAAQELNDAIAAIEALNVDGVEIVSKNSLIYPNQLVN